ncbi:MAG: fdrA domain protein [Rhodospirillaceae bacterium]|nr:fdrA domain protein [Rhodospirillaceae bacterium]
MSDEAVDRLLSGPVEVINLGLDVFAQDLEARGEAVQATDWRPPAGGDAKLAELLAKLGI